MEKLLFSSVSKKFVMALAGFFLMIYLPIHLGINLLLLRNEPETYNKAAYFMSHFWIIRIIEIVLMSAILVHVIWGIYIQVQNWFSRPVRYARPNKSETSFFSRFMIWTGAVVLTFLVLHFFNFYFIKVGFVPGNPEDFYTVAHNLFRIPAYNYLYLLSFAVLGLHLYHAFYSAFQTMGLNHRIWTPVVKAVAVVYAVIIPAGFAFISVSLWLLR